MLVASSSHPPVTRTEILEAASALRMRDCTSGSPVSLIGVLCDERLEADEVAARIEGYPILSASVLRVANSAYYGQSREVTSIKRALMVLGLDAIRAIAAAACIDQVMPKRIACLPDIPLVMRHSLATAVACERLTAVAHPLLAPDAFMAGLLHNLGVVLQASLDPAGVATLIATRRLTPLAPIRVLELQHCRYGHGECAAVLFDEWQLPESLIAVARHHHDPGGAPAPYRLLVSLVGISAALALTSGHAYSLEPAGEVPDLPQLNQAGVSESLMDAVGAALPEQVKLLAQALG